MQHQYCKKNWLSAIVIFVMCMQCHSPHYKRKSNFWSQFGNNVLISNRAFKLFAWCKRGETDIRVGKVVIHNHYLFFYLFNRLFIVCCPLVGQAEFGQKNGLLENLELMQLEWDWNIVLSCLTSTECVLSIECHQSIFLTTLFSKSPILNGKPCPMRLSSPPSTKDFVR